jgi:hypothetical protein
MDHNDMAAHLTRCDSEEFKEVLYIPCNGWDWWYVAEWQWKGQACQVCMKDEGTDCEDGDSDTDW